MHFQLRPKVLRVCAINGQMAFSMDKSVSDSQLDVTVQTDLSTPTTMVSADKAGCLVRIHPLEIENNLVRLTKIVTTLGRGCENDIVCEDTSISRKHAQVLNEDGTYILQDCRSTNGTLVNGKPATEVTLRDGCQIQIGNHIFKFLGNDSLESQYHETIYSMMTKDGLTNVYNKRYLVEILSREFERSKNFNRPFSIILMDIDRFKTLNDTHGHLAGDEVLKGLATRIQCECGADNVFARYGGEEFALLLVETNKCDATKFAEKLRTAIDNKPFFCCAGSLHITASFGVAQCDPQQHATFSDLLEEADRQLYQAKAAGRNAVYS